MGTRSSQSRLSLICGRPIQQAQGRLSLLRAIAATAAARSASLKGASKREILRYRIAADPFDKLRASSAAATEEGLEVEIKKDE